MTGGTYLERPGVGAYPAQACGHLVHDAEAASGAHQPETTSAHVTPADSLRQYTQHTTSPSRDNVSSHHTSRQSEAQHTTSPSRDNVSSHHTSRQSQAIYTAHHIPEPRQRQLTSHHTSILKHTSHPETTCNIS